MVSHPNYSGFQQDQLTQLWIPAHYVRRIELSLGGREILSFDGDISISENPTFRFFVKPQGSDVLHARVVDSEAKVRSEERREGKGCVSTCRSRWWQDNKKKKAQKRKNSESKKATKRDEDRTRTRKEKKT